MISKIYLGVIIHNKHEDSDDIVRHVKSLNSRGNKLISRFKSYSSSVKVKLVCSFLCNAYGSYLRSTYKQYSYERVVVAFNNIYRISFGVLRGESMFAIYVNNNIDSFGLLVRTSVYSFKIHLGVSGNLLVYNVLFLVCFTITLAFVLDGRRHSISIIFKCILCVLFTSLCHLYMEFYILK